MKWIESEAYGNKDIGTFTIYCNDADGWEHGRDQGGDYTSLGFHYKHSDDTGGATFITLEEAEELHKKIGDYIEFMKSPEEFKAK